MAWHEDATELPRNCQTLSLPSLNTGHKKGDLFLERGPAYPLGFGDSDNGWAWFGDSASIMEICFGGEHGLASTGVRP